MSFYSKPEKKTESGPVAPEPTQKEDVREARDTEHGKGANDNSDLKTEVTGAQRGRDGSRPRGEPARSSADSLSSTKAVRPSSPRESEESASPPTSPRDQPTTGMSGADDIEKRQKHHSGVLPGLMRIGK